MLRVSGRLVLGSWVELVHRLLGRDLREPEVRRLLHLPRRHLLGAESDRLPGLPRRDLLSRGVFGVHRLQPGVQLQAPVLDLHLFRSRCDKHAELRGRQLRDSGV